MQIIYNLETTHEPSCIAVGCFDGVHIGHQKIIADMCKYAKENNLISTVFTFPLSPAALLGKSPQRTLTSQNDKMNLLSSLGVQKCFSIDFMNIRNVSAQNYINEILFRQMNAKAVFCGFNYRFGKQAQGDITLLKEICGSLDIETFISEPICFEDSVVSSSRIRTLIEDGSMYTANKLLGRPFSIEQSVVEGKRNGRTIGFPTINQNFPVGFAVPHSGVYASFVHIDAKRYEAVSNIGTRPTVGGTYINLETHIMGGFNENIYGKIVRTDLLYFIREEKKFNGLEELAKQINEDINFIYSNRLYQKYS